MSERFLAELERAVAAAREGRLAEGRLMSALKRWAQVGGDLLRPFLDAEAVRPGDDPDPSTANPAPDGPSAKQDRGGGPLSFGDRYQFVGTLGEGGVSTVSLARDLALGRLVALKELKASLADHSELRSRFGREVRAHASLDHPGIPPLYDSGTHPDGRPWFTMRYIDGEPLTRAAARAHSAGLPAGELTRLVGVLRRACLIVEHAHTTRILHRDLKPGNVMISRSGPVYLIDWGLAKVRGSNDAPTPDGRAPAVAVTDEDTGPGTPLGTRSYASPEQWKGDRTADVAGDVFGLGGILYFLLTGQAPFGGRRDTGDAAPPPPRSLQPATPPTLDAVCVRAVALDPASRYASAGEVAFELGKWLEGQGGLNGPAEVGG